MQIIPRNRNLRYYLALLCSPLLFPATGCARATVGSTIKEDGSWNRVVEFHLPPADKNQILPSKPVNFEDVFSQPPAPWKTSKQVKEDEILITAKRPVALNEVIDHDVTIRSTVDGKNIPVLVNTVSVKETSPGVYTYTERLHWVGPQPKLQIDVDAVKDLRAALPPALATDENVKKTAVALAKEILLAMMGPPDPLISHIMSLIMANPDLAIHQLTAKLRGPIDKVLLDQFGDKMSAEQRGEVAKRIINDAFDNSKSKANVQSNLDPTKQKTPDGATMVALTFVLKYPGKLVKANGTVDALGGEVFWGMYPEAASMGDITLTATCAANGKVARQ